MLTRLYAALTKIEDAEPWTRAYGVARSLLAVATMATILATPQSALLAPFRAGGQVGHAMTCHGIRSVSAFCLVDARQLGEVRWIAIGVLALVASGYRPRWSGIWHWYVSWSLLAAALTDGGDQITAILALLLVPVTLADGRRWHWSTRPAARLPSTLTGFAQRYVTLAALFLIRLQVAAVYFHSAVAKMGRAEWADGTAVYYWLTDPSFGMRGPARHVVARVLATRWGTGIATWGSILTELTLAAAVLLRPSVRRWLLPIGIALHVSIALTIGLTSFSLAMIAALVLYLWPTGHAEPARIPAPVPVLEEVMAGQ